MLRGGTSNEGELTSNVVVSCRREVRFNQHPGISLIYIEICSDCPLLLITAIQTYVRRATI